MLYSLAIRFPSIPWFPITREHLVQCMITKLALHTNRNLFCYGHVFSRTEDAQFHDASHMDLQQLQSALRAQVQSYPLAHYEFILLTLVIRDSDGNRSANCIIPA
ncbi:hypothetical protein NDU88_001364 [Pleurodeles waltl]|uniref:Uncharacterized protein n=1 Tax=Pleurodeles waltl TaxID=8319 RepID=A0AAV7VBL2_PLEWA|nr:hypothetical protein NDU88_001364 [Pleurodeles waltl]